MRDERQRRESRVKRGKMRVERGEARGERQDETRDKLGRCAGGYRSDC
jgi:hypothetical protein